MSPQITTVLQIQIHPSHENITSRVVNEPIKQRANKKKQQQRKHINHLLQQIKQYEQKINAIKNMNTNKQEHPIDRVEKQGQLNNEQVSIVNQKQIEQQTKKEIVIQENIKKSQQVEQEKDHFQYQIEMLRQQNSLLKQQNILLKQQQTLKLKINKTDQQINNQHSNLINTPNKSTFQNQQHINPLPQVAQKNEPILIQDSESQHLSHVNDDHHQIETEHKNFVRSNIRPISSGPILRIRPQSFKKRDAGKIIFVKSKHSNEKPHEGEQGYSSPPYSSGNQQHQPLSAPLNQLKRATQQIKFQEQSSKSAISSQPKGNHVSAFIKQKPIKNKQKSKQKLIKQEAFDKISVIKNTLSERKLSKTKEKQQFNPPKDSKLKNPFQIKLQPNSQKKRPSHNEKQNQNQGQLSVGKSLEFLEFNTVIEKIDLQNISSLIGTDKKISVAQINFQNINISQLNSFQDFLKLVPKFPQLPNPPKFQNTQQELLQLAKQTFPFFDVRSLQSPETDLNVKKFKNCVYFGIDSQHNILWHYDGKLYFGSWKQNENGQGQKSGQGIEFYPKKYVFSGQFSQGKKNGQGILHLLNTSNQSIYIGQFVNGKKQGRGKIVDQAGNIYEGEWYDDKRHGFGLYKYGNGDSYEGIFVKGVKQGFGLEKFNNGDFYRGEYKGDKFQGKGQYIWKNGSQYEGEFHQGRRNGNGIWKSSNLVDAQIYQGEYLNDKKDGYGIYRWYNGSYYQGYFKQDRKHGIGKTRYENEKVAVLQWVDGQSVRRVDKDQWQQFAIEHNQSTRNAEQQPALVNAKFNTFLSYEEVPSYQKINFTNTKKIGISQQQIGSVTGNRDQTYQTYQSQEPQHYQKIFTRIELRQAKYQPVGSNLNIFSL